MISIPQWTAHDLRRTVRTELAILGCPTSVAEAVLGHSPKGIEGTYNLHRYENECELLSNVVYGGSCCSLLMSLHFFHSIDEANIFHNIRCLMYPAPLLSRLRPALSKRFPEAKRVISDGELRC